MSTEKVVVLLISDRDTDERIVTTHRDLSGAVQKAFDDILGCAKDRYTLDDIGVSMEIGYSFEEERHFFCEDNNTDYYVFYSTIED
jgi:hypothetical protein